VEGFDTLGNARPFLNIPVPVLLFLGLAVAFWFLMRFTVFGRSMYAIGSSPVAARMTGIRARRLILVGFVLSGLCISLSGMVLVSQLGATTPNSGFGLELFVITAVILGGASLTGGRGTILGSVLGLLILGVVNNGLVLLNVNTYWQDVVRGGLLILAVAFDQLRVSRASG
jgi:ribose transport system permease protein